MEKYNITVMTENWDNHGTHFSTGKDLIEFVEKFNENTCLVIEMSALQLEYVNISPHIGAILNLYEDHLDHAGTVEHYHENKMNILKNVLLVVKLIVPNYLIVNVVHL